MKYLWQPIQKFIVVALSAPLLLGMGQAEPVEPGRLPTIETIAEAVSLPPVETVQASVQKKPVPKSETAPACIPAEALHAYPFNLYGVPGENKVFDTHITAVYFVPSDQIGGQYSAWQDSLATTFEALKSYFDREFSGRLNLASTVHPSVVLGDHALNEYDALESQNSVSMLSEVEAKIGWSDIKSAQRAAGRYPVLIVFYHTGFEDRFQNEAARLSTFGWLGAAFLPAFHLIENSPERESGLIVSAHEFAHLLGIPHPWEMDPAIEDEPTNLMGYQAHAKLSDTHIDSGVKEAMGWCPTR